MIPSRLDLAGDQVEQLRGGGGRKPDVLCVRAGESVCVVKDAAAGGRLGRRFRGWLVRRELRAYEQLAGHPAVPRAFGRVDDLAFALEYRPGEVMGPRLSGQVPGGFIPELRDAVHEMHARGVVHLDLRHRSNVLAGRDGHPVLIDFASAICFRPGGWGARLVLPLLAWVDRRAVDKWERQLRAASS